MARRHGGHRQYLAQLRRGERLAASREAEVLSARLRVHLSQEQWTEVEAGWEARPDLYLPQDRVNFLVSEAQRLGRLDLVPLTAIGG